MPTTLSFAAHLDDDLLFMNYDIIGDIRAGYGVVVVYLTAGNLADGPAGRAYARQRLRGEMAAYAVAAQRPNAWTHEPVWIGGRELDSYNLHSTAIRLVCTNIDAAAGAADPGDLHRMWHQPGYVAVPIDSRPGYTRAEFIELLRTITAWVTPSWTRTHDTWGQDTSDHIDHIAAAHLAAEALSPGGVTQILRWEYFGYRTDQLPANLSPAETAAKRAVWNAYLPYDDQLGPGAWDNVMNRQHRRRHYDISQPWQPRTGW